MDTTMPSLSQHIAKRADELPEGSLLCPRALLHLGSRAAVDQALSRLARRGQLMRVCQGVYVRPIETRFGLRPPAVEKVIEALAELWGETIVPCGGAAANFLGLTTQTPVQSVYLTSGPSRRLKLGALTVHLRHAPRWQLVAPHRPAGDAIRALAWLGEIEENLGAIASKLSPADLEEFVELRVLMPARIAELMSAWIGQNPRLSPDQTCITREHGLKMKDTSAEKEILDEIHKLGKGQQAEVLEFVRSLANSEMEGVPGKTLLRFAGTIDRKDLDRMTKAIQIDCESDPQGDQP